MKNFFDICATTIIRACFKVDLTIGHKNNLYQKLVSRYQSHIKVTFSFAITQIVFGYLGVSLINSLMGSSLQIPFFQFIDSIVQATTIQDLFMMILKPTVFGIFIYDIINKNSFFPIYIHLYS